MASHQILPLAGYTPTIGRLVGMLTFSRETLIKAVDGLSIADLDHLQDAASNSIGGLLAHVTAVERLYQVVTFENREPSPAEAAAWDAALHLGDAGRHHLRGRTLHDYLAELSQVRDVTLAALAARDDEWLERPLPLEPTLNAHWAWFHVAEDETSHRGQIRWLRARLPASV